MEDDHDDVVQRIERVKRMQAQANEERRTLREQAQQTADAIRRQREELEALWDHLHDSSDPPSAER